MRSSDVAAGDTGTIGQYNKLRDDAYASSMLLAHEQSSPDLTLYVEPGKVYINGTLVEYAGGNSPSFTAPSTNPRIDVLSINSSGTLVRTAGTEAASPVAPACPVDQLPICQVYNKVSQTQIVDVDATGKGYILKDVRRFIALPKKPTVQTFTSANSVLGSSTTRFDITNPAGSTFRYTWDGTGTDPAFSSANNPVGSAIQFNCQNFSAGNNGLFLVTGSGTNYVEVTNASGVAEVDKTIGTGYVLKQFTYTKPTGLAYAVVEVQGSGGSGANSTGSVSGGGGGGGGYSRELILADSLATVEPVALCPASIGSGSNAFGSHCSANNGGNASTSTGGSAGTATGGDLNVSGQAGTNGFTGTANYGAGHGGHSFLGKGGSGASMSNTTGTAFDGPAGFLGGGGGGACSASDGSPTGNGGAGGIGIVIVTEYYN